MASTPAGHLGLSQQQLARALRNFTLMGALWAVYGPNATVTGPILSGLCLQFGLSDSQIAFLVSLTSVMGLSQLLSYFLTGRARNKRRMMVALGCCEITLTSSVILIVPHIDPSLRFHVLGAFLASALFFGHAVSPRWTSWMSAVIPADIRSQYIGRRMFTLTAVGMAYLFLASRFLDLASWPINFTAVYALGFLGGIGGYLVAAVTPYPQMEEEDATSPAELIIPLRDPPFVRLCIFLVAWTAAMMVAGAFYSVYMLRYLHLSYLLVAIFTNINLVATMIGYRFWGDFAQKYGSKPVIQILVAPLVLVPLLWVLTSPGGYWSYITIAMVVGGIAGSGVSVTLSSLLFKTIPQGRDTTGYFVIWTAFSTLGSAAGPLLSGVLRNSFGDFHTIFFGLNITSLQMIFAVASAATLVPLALSFFLREPEAASPMYVLGQFRGNLFSFAYNSALYAIASEDETRAGRLRALGRSKSPLAVDPLVRGLRDSSPVVRAGAAEGLGESGLDEGLDALVEVLGDEESDVRPAVAEALGRLGKPEGVHPLIQYLHDDDTRLSISAAHALGEIGGPDAREALYQALLEPGDRHSFAALVDAASRTDDLRIVEPAFRHLPDLHSPVMRMHVLNAVGRVLGEKSHFYRLSVTDRLGRAAMIAQMMARLGRLARAVKLGTEEQRSQLECFSADIASAASADDYDAFQTRTYAMADLVLGIEGAMPVVYAAARGILLYCTEGECNPEEGLVFLTICLTSIARHLVMTRPHRHAE